MKTDSSHQHSQKSIFLASLLLFADALFLLSFLPYLFFTIPHAFFLTITTDQVLSVVLHDDFFDFYDIIKSLPEVFGIHPFLLLLVIKFTVAVIDLFLLSLTNREDSRTFSRHIIGKKSFQTILRMTLIAAVPLLLLLLWNISLYNDILSIALDE